MAEELGAALLIDDREARMESHRRGIEYFGSLRVLKVAKERGIVAQVGPELHNLINSGTCIGKALCEELLKQIGEAE